MFGVKAIEFYRDKKLIATFDEPYAIEFDGDQLIVNESIIIAYSDDIDWILSAEDYPELDYLHRRFDTFKVV